MLTVYGYEFMFAFREIQNAYALASKPHQCQHVDIEGIKKTLEGLTIYLESVELKSAKRQAARVNLAIDTILHPSMHSGSIEDKYSFVAGHLRELITRIVDDLEDRAVCYFDDEETKFLSKGRDMLGEHVVSTFPKAKTDLEEATNCYGHARYTACVFHLMRAMEIALHDIGNHWKATVIDKNNKTLVWGKILDSIDAEIKKMPVGPEKDNRIEIVALLRNVKDCWRNNTMHPKNSYSKYDARAVFEAVKNFLNRLAQELKTP